MKGKIKDMKGHATKYEADSKRVYCSNDGPNLTVYLFAQVSDYGHMAFSYYCPMHDVFLCRQPWILNVYTRTII